MNWNYHRDAQGRNVYHVNDQVSPQEYCMCSVHARNSVSLSSLSSLNLSSSPSAGSSPSPTSGGPPTPSPGIGGQTPIEGHHNYHHNHNGHLMLSMQYSHSNGNLHHHSYHQRKYMKAHYHNQSGAIKNGGRNRRLSGTFLPEQLLAVPSPFKVKS